MMNNKWLLTGVVSTIMVLTGCAADPYKTDTSFASGDTLTVHQAISIQAGQTRAYFQYGKATTQSQFERYDQHCRFEIKTLSEQVTTIKPGKFTISHIAFGEEMIAQIASKQLVAFNQLGSAYPTTQTDFIKPNSLLAFGSDYSDVPETFEIIHFTLHSMAQRNVLRLTCASALSNGNSMNEPRNLRPKRIDIKNILGNTASISRLYKDIYYQ